jgi:hypothetical protein
MLQMSSFYVADACCWLLQTLNFNVADVEFRCCRLAMLGFVLRRRGKLLMLDVACATRVATWSQHSRNTLATWEEEGGGLLMVDVARNTVATWSQYSRNMIATWDRNMGGGRRPADILMLRAICSQHCSQ